MKSAYTLPAINPTLVDKVTVVRPTGSPFRLIPFPTHYSAGLSQRRHAFRNYVPTFVTGVTGPYDVKHSLASPKGAQ
jgi:hypothetical protein